MKILTSKRNGNIYNLEIECSIESIERWKDEAFKKLVVEAKIPGFRKGKISRAMFEKYYGKEPIVQEALMHLINEDYAKAVEDLNLQIIDYPKNIEIAEYKEDKPLTFKCAVDVKPIAKLGKYKGLKVTKEPEEITEEEFKQKLKEVLARYIEFVEKDGESQKDNLVHVLLNAQVDGAVYQDWSGKDYKLKVGENAFGEEFDANLLGLKKNDVKEFKVTFPKDFVIPNLVEKEVTFKIETKAVLEEKLPELTDELVQKIVGPESETKTVDAFQKMLRDNANKQAKQKSEEKINEDIMDQIVDDIKVEVPQIMIDKEIESSLKYFESVLRQSRMTMESYLEMTKKHIDDIKAEMKEPAVKRIKRTLALEAIIEKENINVDQADVDAEMKKWNIQDASKLDLNSFKEVLKHQKTYKFLLDNAKIINKK